MRRTLQGWGLAGIALVFALISIASALPAHAATGSLNYTLLGTHPQAAAQSTPYGQTIHKLEFLSGKLYAGYGDYHTNTGPIVINPFNLTSSSFEGSQLSVPTEEISQWRVLNGKLYAPYIDPQGGPITTGGYASGTPWANHTVIPDAEHGYDMATLTGTDLWIAGAGLDTGVESAVVWRSTDGGSTWNIVRSDTTSPTPQGNERYYWLAVLGGKMYMQANNVIPATPVRIFDGTSWTSGTTETIAPSESRVVVFDNKVITTKDDLSAFDGTTVSKINSYQGGEAIDMYVDSGYLYVLRSNGTITRTADLATWQDLGNASTGAQSIAVASGVIYLGTTQSQLFKSTTAIPATLPAITLTAPSDNATLSGTVNLTVNATGESIEKVEYRLGTQVVATLTAAPYNIAWNSLTKINGSYQLTARLTDVYGNVRTTSPISITINNTEPSPDSDPTPTSEPASTSSAATVAQRQPSTARRVIRAVQQAIGIPVTASAQETSQAPNEQQQAEMEQKLTEQQNTVQATQSKNHLLVAGGAVVLLAGGTALFFALRPRPPV